MGRPASEAIVRRVVREVPDLEPLLQGHLDFTDGEILSHPFFSELTKQVQSWVGGASPKGEANTRRVLEVLEEAYVEGNLDVQSLIALSFIESLEPKEPGYQEVRALLGPSLRAELAQVESR